MLPLRVQHSAFAFTFSSSFTPSRPQFTHSSSPATTTRAPVPHMVTPKEVRRSEEIKRLTKQLEELRATRARISGSRAPPPSTPSSSTTSLSAPSAAPSIEETFGSASVTPPASAPMLPLGKHGAGSRFLSLSEVASDEYFPRILPVAGRLPDLTVAQLRATPSLASTRPPSQANLFLTKVPPSFSGHVVALPGLQVVAACRDPVALLAPAEQISAARLPTADGDDVVLLLDRAGNPEFNNQRFYAWAEGGKVRVGWLKEMPPDGMKHCLGEIIFGMIEVRKELRAKRSCWEEENEVY